MFMWEPPSPSVCECRLGCAAEQTGEASIAQSCWNFFACPEDLLKTVLHPNHLVPLREASVPLFSLRGKARQNRGF